MRKTARALLAAAVMLLAAAAALKDDETVIFFPTYAVQSADGESWQVPVHAWVFELEKDSPVRSATLGLFAKSLGLSPDAAEQRIFRDRARYFLADNESSKELELVAGEGGKPFRLSPSERSGHSKTVLALSGAAIKSASEGRVLRLPLKDAQRRENAEATLPGAAGWSVVSDIDDTVKISEVHDREALLRRTFLSEFEAVPGMAERYNAWHEQGGSFHYVSASPWQLYPALRRFFDNAGFPMGSFHLKDFRWKDRSFFNLFQSGGAAKRQAIEQLLQTFPERSFILVGDTGEEDPELFGAAAREYPKQVQRIFLRRCPCPGEQELDKRLSVALHDVPKEKWLLFSTGHELPGSLPPHQQR